MRIAVFLGGLGNQIFEYAFLQTFMRARFSDELIYGVFNKKKLSEHHGLEIDKWFDVDLPKSHWWVDIITACLYVYKKINPKTRMLDLNQRECLHENAFLFYPSKFNKKYVPSKIGWLNWKIKEEQLNEKNIQALRLIRNTYSVFVHVRRGDYLSPAYKSMFEGCCSLEYYEEAIKCVREKNPNARFFCFSDDISWAKENLALEDAMFVDWNKGTDSPIDMYLMSFCKGAIIANSTFSYWGARLTQKKDFVYYPKRWINLPEGNFDICPDEWLAL